MQIWEILDRFPAIDEESKLAIAKYAQENDQLKYRRWKFLQAFAPKEGGAIEDKG